MRVTFPTQTQLDSGRVQYNDFQEDQHWPPPIPFDSWEVGEEYDQVDDYCWEVFLEAEWEGETYVASGVTVHGDLCDIYEDTIEVKEA